MMQQDLKHTPLFDVHRRLGARMVDFGGWEMPLHYGSQLEEHHRVRKDAGMFDVSHMLAIDLQGLGAREFLRGLLANDVARLHTIGKALYSCMLNDAGGVLDDLIVYRLGDQQYRLVVNAATAEKDLRWIAAQRDALGKAGNGIAEVEIMPRRDCAIIAIQGPAARERFWQSRPRARTATESLPAFQGSPWTADSAERSWFIARTGYTGEDGFEVVLPAGQASQLWEDLLQAGVAPCGLGARDTLRLEAGMNLYGQDMDETVTPSESGLAWTVDLSSERKFVGRDAITATPPQHQLVGLMLVGKGVLRSHQTVRAAQGLGMTTSGGFAPTLNASIALARVPLGIRVGDDVDVEIRAKWTAAKVVKYPFVRHGKALVALPLS
jgi:aminomethyltransferase